jgi:hypothetical protein
LTPLTLRTATGPKITRELRNLGDLVDAWLAQADGGLFDLTASRRWLAAEAAALRGDSARARRGIAEARAALGRVHDPASHAMLVEALNALEGRLADRKS